MNSWLRDAYVLILDYVFVFNISAFLSGLEGQGRSALPRRVHPFRSWELVSLLVVPASELWLVADGENVLARLSIGFSDLKLDLHFW